MTSLKIGNAGPASDETIFAPIIGAPADRPFVVAQLGQSLDGRIATINGDSRWINGSSALDHLHRLRSHVDAVVVGIGTVIADDPQLTVRRVPGPQPRRVIIDPRGRLKASARCLTTGDSRCIVVSNTERSMPQSAELLVVKASDPHIEPTDIVAALFERGLKKILVEGGARTVSHFVDSGIVDRIHILVAPMILGSGIRGLSLSPISNLKQALRPETRVHVLDGGDVLFDCDLRHQRRG
jgi:diaminohydroxyphosphoribosylaminopyrimidine deaminase / 5-amino-6-(5-phosphoribosylamino)uracil reductase